MSAAALVIPVEKRPPQRAEGPRTVKAVAQHADTRRCTPGVRGARCTAAPRLEARRIRAEQAAHVAELVVWHLLAVVPRVDVLVDEVLRLPLKASSRAEQLLPGWYMLASSDGASALACVIVLRPVSYWQP